jgi:hypothetical protein
MARRRGTGAESSSSLIFPPPGGLWQALQALMEIVDGWVRSV